MSESSPVTNTNWYEIKQRQIDQFPEQCRVVGERPKVCPFVDDEVVYLTVRAIMEEKTMREAVEIAQERAKGWDAKCCMPSQVADEIVVYVDEDESGLPVFYLEEEQDGNI